MTDVLVVGDDDLASKLGKVVDNVVLFVGYHSSLTRSALELIASSVQVYECIAEQLVITIEGYGSYVSRDVPCRTPKKKEKARGTGPR